MRLPTVTPGFGVDGLDARYYGRELWRRLRHYARIRALGYPNRGSLSDAAESILAARAESGFASGGHFRGVWPRDLCFAAAGFRAAGYVGALRAAGGGLAEILLAGDVFYTDVHDGDAAAAPAEGVDTFPALVILLARCDGLTERAEAIATLARRHRRRFFDDDLALVTGSGSSWWDSAAAPRETYNTAMLLAAIERLDDAGIETPYAGLADEVRDGMLTHLWSSGRFLEHRASSTLGCDANVVPLYFELIDRDRARSIVDAVERLATPNGLRLRARPFARSDVRPHFLLHRDYHYHVWPWNSYMYVNGARGYGFDEAARQERERVDAAQREYGTFLEVIALDGTPYVKRGYASASDFTVAAALWTEARERRRSG